MGQFSVEKTALPGSALSGNQHILMRALFGAGTPREAADVRFAFLIAIQDASMIAFVILAEADVETAALIVTATAQAA